MWRSGRIDLIWVRQYNVRAYVRFVGSTTWWKLTNPDDDVTTALLQVCIHAKATNGMLTYREAAGEIQEVYVT